MIEKLQNLKVQGSIAVMSDFIIDRIIKLKSKQDLFDMINNKSKFGAGAIRGIQTYENKGGKAVNVAYCLAKLGVNVTLFTIADKVGLAILEHFFSDFGSKVNLRIKNGRQGYSTAFEFLDETDKVFLSDIGDNDKFGPNMINSCKDDIEILKNAAAVVLVDWASNSLGTELAEYIFKNSTQSLHFVDTGDIQTRKKDIPKLIQVLADTKGILSMNENECNSFAEVINFNSLDIVEKEDTATIEENVQEYLKKFVKKTKFSIDLHASKYTAWSDGIDTAFVPTRKVKINNLVGAGDSWDAADIIGYLSGLDPKERLAFSNAYVSLYISNPNSEPATMNQVIELLKN
jgi:ribokinase